MSRRDIVAIGGSSGSGAVLRSLLSALPADLPAAILLCPHMPAHRRSYTTAALEGVAAMPIHEAIDGQPVQEGHIYVAAPDHHLLLIGGVLRLGTGPRENMVRPAIDALFRSAALSAGERVIGVVLSGMLDDGAAGLAAIKQRGGLAVVQSPLDADAEDMPLAALQATEVDHVAPLARLAETIAALVGGAADPGPPATSALRLEVQIAAGSRLGSDELMAIADPTTLTCPECHGVLSEVRGSKPLRFRCQIGHAFTAHALIEQRGELDEAMSVAMRIMEERVTLVERMARDARGSGHAAVAELYERRAVEYAGYAETLRQALSSALGTEHRKHGRD